MMRLTVFLFFLIFSGCSSATENNAGKVSVETCDITFNMAGPCQYKQITVNMNVEKRASDEIALVALNVVNQGKVHLLKITKDVSMLDGDKGYISFSDINFDGSPDLAITTSFGLANLYLDYWVYDTDNKKYSYIGNFSVFKFDFKNKVLSNTVKVNAAKYENTTYKWNRLKLIKNK